jgi:hypothetical protein
MSDECTNSACNVRSDLVRNSSSTAVCAAAHGVSCRLTCCRVIGIVDPSTHANIMPAAG